MSLFQFASARFRDAAARVLDAVHAVAGVDRRCAPALRGGHPVESALMGLTVNEAADATLHSQSSNIRLKRMPNAT